MSPDAQTGIKIEPRSDGPFHRADEAESTVVQQAVAYWESLRAGRRFASRTQVTLRGLGALAKHAVLVRVIDGGADYEFRIVGNVPATAVGRNFRGRHMSDPEVDAVMRSNYRHQLYDEVVRTGEPKLFKCRLVDPTRLNLPVCSETVFLPLGEDDVMVDHLLGFTVFSAGGPSCVPGGTGPQSAG